MKIFFCGFFILLASLLKAQHLDLNTSVHFTPVNAKRFELKLLKENTASVILFFSPQCPICIKMTKTVREMADSFSLKNVKFYLIYPGKFYSKRYIRSFQKKYMLAINGYIDDNSELVKVLGATVTPQAYVLDSSGNTIYSGKIDNWFEDIGKRRTIITEFYLRDALNATLQNQQPTVRKTEPVGCFINAD